MSKYKGLFTFDINNHRYIPVEQADGLIDCMDFIPNEHSKSLIKYEKARRAIKAWAEANNLHEVLYSKKEDCLYSPYGSDEHDISYRISFDLNDTLKGLIDEALYTITELCGEE